MSVAHRVARRFARWLSYPTLLMRLSLRRVSTSPTIFLIATPSHTNLGDHAIVEAEKALLDDLGLTESVVELERYQYEKLRGILQRLIKNNDLIIIDGGGNVGTLWPGEDAKMRDIVTRFLKNPIVVFPQTVYFGDGSEGEWSREEFVKAYAGHERLTLLCRDEGSYNEVRSLAPSIRCLLVPDIVTYLSPRIGESAERSGVLLCLRDDLERMTGEDLTGMVAHAVQACGESCSQTSTHATSNVSPMLRNGELVRKWAEFASARLVVTDRLHGMIFSAINGTPCLALDNASHKVSGGARWLSYLGYIRVCKTPEELVGLIPEWLSLCGQSYDKRPLAPHHERIKGEVLHAVGKAADRD